MDAKDFQRLLDAHQTLKGWANNMVDAYEQGRKHIPTNFLRISPKIAAAKQNRADQLQIMQEGLLAQHVDTKAKTTGTLQSCINALNSNHAIDESEMAAIQEIKTWAEHLVDERKISNEAVGDLLSKLDAAIYRRSSGLVDELPAEEPQSSVVQSAAKPSDGSNRFKNRGGSFTVRASEAMEENEDRDRTMLR